MSKNAVLKDHAGNQVMPITKIENVYVNANTTLDTTLGGLSWEVCTQEEYDAMETHEATTIYYATGDNKVTEYLGDIKMQSGSGDIAGSLLSHINGYTGTSVAGANPAESE